MSFQEKFLELLANSTIVQGLLTVMVVGTWLYLIATAANIPDSLNQIVGLVVGFYFGAKIQNAFRRAEAVQRALEKDC